MNKADLINILSDLKMNGTRLQEWNFNWRVISAQDEDGEGFNIQCSFERPNVEGDVTKNEEGYGRKWYVGTQDSIERVVFTAWMAIEQILKHEQHEAFTFRGVVLLDPHKSLLNLGTGSRHVL